MLSQYAKGATVQFTVMHFKYSIEMELCQCHTKTNFAIGQYENERNISFDVNSNDLKKKQQRAHIDVVAYLYHSHESISFITVFFFLLTSFAFI